MIRAGRRPRDRSEHMILDNFRAMQAVRRIRDKPLTPGRVPGLHTTLMSGTLDDPEAAGRIQRPGDERVRVVDHRDRRVLHTPPPAEELPGRLDAMIRDLDAGIEKKVAETREVERRLRQASDLNHRQLALLAHAIRHPAAGYTIREHRTSHGVAYATARADLLRLAELGLLDRRRAGKKTNVFDTPPDLDDRIRSPSANA